MNESEDVRLIQDLFRKADEDKNGSLSRTELRSIMTILLNGKGNKQAKLAFTLLRL